MSVGPMGMISSIAATPGSRASETERAHQDAAGQTRQAQADQSAEAASGIGETEQEEGTSDRDADGRRLWEQIAGPDPNGEDEEADGSKSQSKDPTGSRGANLDLSG